MMQKVTTKGNNKGSKALAAWMNKIQMLAGGWKTKITGAAPVSVTNTGDCLIISVADSVDTVIGKTNATWTRGTLASPTSCSISIWMTGTTLGDAWTDTGEDVTAYDTGMIPSSASPIASGTQVRLRRMDFHWIYDGHDCG